MSFKTPHILNTVTSILNTSFPSNKETILHQHLIPTSQPATSHSLTPAAHHTTIHHLQTPQQITSIATFIANNHRCNLSTNKTIHRCNSSIITERCLLAGQTLRGQEAPPYSASAFEVSGDLLVVDGVNQTPSILHHPRRRCRCNGGAAPNTGTIAKPSPPCHLFAAAARCQLSLATAAKISAMASRSSVPPCLAMRSVHRTSSLLEQHGALLSSAAAASPTLLGRAPRLEQRSKKRNREQFAEAIVSGTILHPLRAASNVPSQP